MKTIVPLLSLSGMLFVLTASVPAQQLKTPQDVLNEVNKRYGKGDWDGAIAAGNKVKQLDPHVKNGATPPIYSTMATCYLYKARRLYAARQTEAASLNFRYAAMMNRIYAESAVAFFRKNGKNFPGTIENIRKEYTQGLRSK